MINTRSDFLVILIATYNRLEALKRAIDSIIAGTQCSHEIIVIDGGSTDGTIEYLKSQNKVTPVFQGKLMGVPLAYNQVWREVESEYTCWLSDDTEILPGALDLAIQILESDPEIGMVGLKTKDVVGPWTGNPYQGAVSAYGILNCNHGVLPMQLLRAVDYFNEDYPMYMIDPDLTASILSTGKKVVMTKSIFVLHHREWALKNPEEEKKNRSKNVDNNQIYINKFAYLRNRTLFEKAGGKLAALLDRPLIYNTLSRLTGNSLNWRDWHNLIRGKYISIFDPLTHRNRQYYLEQKIPSEILRREGNPYRHLLQD